METRWFDTTGQIIEKKKEKKREERKKGKNEWEWINVALS